MLFAFGTTKNNHFTKDVVQDNYNDTYRHFGRKAFNTQKRVVEAEVKKKRYTGELHQAGNDPGAQKSASLAQHQKGTPGAALKDPDLVCNEGENYRSHPGDDVTYSYGKAGQPYH